MKLNYDNELLFLESDERGFILGQSHLGSGILRSSAGSWVDIKGDFSSISLTRSVSVDQGILFRPETATLSLNTVVDSWADGAYGRNIRLRYGDEILFMGTIKSVGVTDAVNLPDRVHGQVATRIQLTAQDTTTNLNNFIWNNWNRSAESASTRAAAAWPGVSTAGLSRTMAASTDVDNPTALQVLTDVADAALARFYVDRTNVPVIDATTPTDPTVYFVDEYMDTVVNQAPSWGSTVNATQADSTDHGYYTATSRKVTPAGTFTNAGILTTTVATTAGDLWNASAMLYTDGALPISFSLEWLAGNNASLGTVNREYAPDASSWTLYELPATAPFGAAKVRIRIEYNGTPTAAQPIYVNGLALTKGLQYTSWDKLKNPGDNQVYGYFRDLARQEVLDDSVSSVVAIAKSDETKTATRTLSGSVITNEQRYTVDILSDPTSMQAWVNSFPLRGFTQQQPTAMTARFSPDLLGLDLCDLVSVSLRGQDYECGITGIQFDISPVDGWSVAYSLVPGYTIRHGNLVVPSAPQNVGSTNAGRNNAITLVWNPPTLTGSMTGYEIRYAVGSQPPATRTSGTLAGTATMSATSFTVTGLNHKTDYAFSIFAVTSDPAIWSRSTDLDWTAPTIPSVPRNVVVTKLSQTSLRVTWLLPTTPGDLGGYDVRWSGGASGAAYPALNATSYIITGLPKNKTFTITVEARTVDWHNAHYGSGKVTVSGNTNS